MKVCSKCGEEIPKLKQYFELVNRDPVLYNMQITDRICVPCYRGIFRKEKE